MTEKGDEKIVIAMPAEEFGRYRVGLTAPLKRRGRLMSKAEEDGEDVPSSWLLGMKLRCRFVG